MKINTRFNPTVNGYLHLGHAVNILVNYTEAKATGGKFGVRFDDTQDWWIWKNKGRETEFEEQMLKDIEWLGIKPDFVHYQSDMMKEIDSIIENFPEQQFYPDQYAEVVGSDHAWYPLTTRFTIEKVLMDKLDDINWLIRGIDLLTEDCLYKYFVELCRVTRIRMTYIPRLEFEGDEISKTKGGFKIKDYKDKRIIDKLAKDCLIDPKKGWFVNNLKPRLILGKWAK